MDSRHRRRSLLLLAAALTARLAGAAPVWYDSPAHDLVVTDLSGRRVQPLAASDVRTTVFVFTRTDCPIAARYLPELQRLQRRASAEELAFWLVFVDRDQPAAAIRAYLESYGFHGRVLKDEEHALVRLTGVTITPEAAVFSREASGPTLVYRGRIDDRYVEPGRARPAPTVRDLDEVLNALSGGASIRFRSTEAVGCVIADLR
jgi:Redoxin